VPAWTRRWRISRRPRDAAAAIATSVQMALTPVFWEQMMRYFERQPQRGDTEPK
jgi:hypothetical protein